MTKSRHSEAAWDALLTKVRAGTRRTEEALDRTIARCNESNERMARVDEWMRERDNYERKTRR